MNDSNPYQAPSSDYTARPVEAPVNQDRIWPWLLAGFLVFVADFIQLVVVVGVFRLVDEEPAWEKYYAVFTMGVLPLVGLGLLLVGLFRFLRRF